MWKDRACINRITVVQDIVNIFMQILGKDDIV